MNVELIFEKKDIKKSIDVSNLNGLFLCIYANVMQLHYCEK